MLVSTLAAPSESHIVLARPWEAERRLIESPDAAQIHYIIPPAAGLDCNTAWLSCQTESPGLHLSFGSIFASETQGATSLSCVCEHTVACPYHALLSQIGVWFRMAHLTELRGDHSETSLSWNDSWLPYWGQAVSRQQATQGWEQSVLLTHSMWCYAISIDAESVNLPKPFLVKVGLLFAMMVHMLSTLQGWCPMHLAVIAYQGLCATSFEMLLIPTACVIYLDLDCCSAGDCNKHCNFHLAAPWVSMP